MQYAQLRTSLVLDYKSCSLFSFQPYDSYDQFRPYDSQDPSGRGVRACSAASSASLILVMGSSPLVRAMSRYSGVLHLRSHSTRKRWDTRRDAAARRLPASLLSWLAGEVAPTTSPGAP